MRTNLTAHRTILLTAILLSGGIVAKCQEKADYRITITVSDTTGLYEKVKTAFIKQDFMIKELGYRDSITTYRRELRSTTGVAIGYAKIEGNKVMVRGIYSQKTKDLIGITEQQGNFKNIM